MSKGSISQRNRGSCENKSAKIRQVADTYLTDTRLYRIIKVMPLTTKETEKTPGLSQKRYLTSQHPLGPGKGKLYKI